MPRVLIAALVLLLVAAPAAPAQEARPLQGISVLGDGEAFADNDVGTFRFGVSVRRTTAAAALRSGSAAVQRVVGAVRAAGVAREDVQTDVIAVERVTTGPRTRRGWIARNTITATVRRLDGAGTVVDRAVGAGATSVEGPELGVADTKEVYRQALVLALADARAKAERLAAAAGVVLGAPTAIREAGADPVPPAPEPARTDEVQSGAGSTPEVEPGHTTVTAQVVVTFAVLPPG